MDSDDVSIPKKITQNSLTLCLRNLRENVFLIEWCCCIFFYYAKIINSWDTNWVGPPALIHYRGRRSFHFFKLWCTSPIISEKNIYYNFEFEHNRVKKKLWVLKKYFIFKKLLQNYNIFFRPLLINGIGSWISCITFLVSSITYILVIKID